MNHRLNVRTLAGAIVAVALALPLVAVEAKPFRWSSQGDILTFDPHAQNEGLNNSVMQHVYEPLVKRNRELKIVPALAVSWTNPDPATWRMKLRSGVKFHDGTPFTADDVAFSITRLLHKDANFKANISGIKGAKKVDDLTVDIQTEGPNPVFLNQLTELMMMSKTWCEKNNVVKPQDYAGKEETFAARNANGTGAYTLVSIQRDVQTVLKANPEWWGLKDGQMTGNISEIIYRPIKADATRVAALLSGEIDFLLDPPPQDLARIKANPQLKALEGNENRIIFLGMDQWRDELLYGNVKTKNPFKDPRVRQAIYHAIDVEAIKRSTMRGLSIPAGSLIPPQSDGYAKENDQRLPFDVEKAKKLMADAGYANGFEVTIDCPNNRYVNDEAICTAVAGMLAKINIKLNVNAMPRANYFPKIQKFDTSFYLLGWGTATFDAHYTLSSLMQTYDGKDGEFNLGKYSNKRVDELVNAMKTETNRDKRLGYGVEALRLHNADVGHVPLHFQVIPWAMRANIETTHRANNYWGAWWTTVK